MDHKFETSNPKDNVQLTGIQNADQEKTNALLQQNRLFRWKSTFKMNQ